VLAHTTTDLAPSWLLVATLLVTVALTWTWLRTGWTTARLDPNAGVLLPAWTAPALRGLGVVAAAAGLVVWAFSLTSGLVADQQLVDYLAPFVANQQLLVIGMLLAALVGDWWAAASPFATLARLLPDRPGGDAPAWTGPALLATFVWLATCYSRPGTPGIGDPKAIGVWLLAYTVAVLVGAWRWGRWWVRSGEGFAVLFASCALLSPLGRDLATGRLRLRPPLSGLGGPLPAGAATACILAAGGAMFRTLSLTNWWAEIAGTRSGWSRSVVSTIGLLFLTGLAALLVTAATRAQRSPSSAGLVPLAVGIAGASLLAFGLVRVIDATSVLSDPYGDGWDLLGTIAWRGPAEWESSRRLAWTELAVLLLGTVGGLVAAHDATLRSEGGRASAERALLPQLAAGSVLAVVVLLVLLG
jgi:hypothetical protein